MIKNIQTIKSKNTMLFTFRMVTLLAALTIINSGCDDGDENGGTELTFANSVKGKTWKLSSAKVDGVDKTDVYKGLTMTFNEGTYAATNGDPLFKTTGTWKELTKNEEVEFDGVLPAEVVLVSKDKFTLKFSWDDTTYGSGRVSSVEGDHEFEMVVQ
jgi:hypothetical protein